ncbi:hypothetical protein HCH_01992 [Hahella chejuensis KCTC 2396]|uniref:Uncharacterized protein n=1 Tax=Hahella chejuensis (strain KCTC 2396) TaxID=349521 RepID=Q2SKJ9_HAHCH|nr:hypothetical protein [Hahella chejuensis]ABC28825.1 hypothetical protein HCH_01992 [Hahella chejuensis KCTC 2396]
MAKVLSVSKSAEHRFSKTQAPTIHLIAGEGVDGDAIAVSLPPEPYLPLAPV